MSVPGGSELSRLLDAALELPPDARAQWLDELDASHDELKPRLRALLARAAEIESRDFLGSLPPLPADDDTDAAGESVGARIGPYRLERPIGAGGMGTVWLASQADGLFERQVALKLPHRGMFGAGLAERMARERAILAALEHPHIARLYGAGLTEDGQPYLALEYVQGLPIDEYCRQRDLGLRERVQLMVQVADAVAAAHARLVVHRDLKPANILVTPEGYVRLLDFGIAKLLDSPAESGTERLTQLSVHALTPDYASPEQIRGEAVTIASDIYSLGVVIYELLAGERPYRLKRDTRGALEDAILDTQPRRPSEVTGERALRGDLDTIVLKALNKDPGTRYATVNAFADDLRNHLEGRPVMARPDGAWYRASRFLRRNRLAVGAAAVVVLALIVAAVGTTVGLIRARAAERQALAQAQTSREVASFVVDLFKVSDPGEARGNTITAREILDRASARMGSELTTQPSVRAELLFTMADVYSKLGLYQQALDLAQSGLALRRTLGDDEKLAGALDQVGEIQSLLRKGREAVPLHEEALALRRAAAPPDPGGVARTQQRLAVAQYAQGDFDGALRLIREARSTLAALEKPDPRQLGELLAYRAVLLHEKGDFEQAIPGYREALQIFRTALGPDHPLVASTLGDLAIALKDTRQFDEAEKAYTDSLAIQRKVLGPRHPDVGNALNNLSVMYMDQGKFEQARVTAQEGSDILRAALGDDHEMTNIVRLNLGRSHVQLGNYPVAESEFRDVLMIRQRTAAPDKLPLAITLDALADVLNRQSKFTEALGYARQARVAMESAVGREHWRWAGAGRTLGTTLVGLRRYGEAESVLLDSYALLERKRGAAHRTTKLTASRIADLYKAWGKPSAQAEWQARAQSGS